MYDVITIGSASRDVFLKTGFKTGPFEETPTGTALIVPLGEKFAVQDAVFTIGGNAANAGVTFARQGFKTALVTKLGPLHTSAAFIHTIKDEGIDLQHVKSSKLPTNYSVILLQNGERTILSYHGSLNDFSINDISLRKLKAKWWYVSLTGKSYKMFSELVRFAAEHDIKVALNPSGMHIDEGREQLLADLPYVSFLVMNELEASHFTGVSFKEPEKMFSALDAVVPGIVAVTRGDDGVTVSDGVNRYSAGVFSAGTIVDRTGAGDAFGSGFVSGLIRSGEMCDRTRGCKPENIEYAIRLASANAASVIGYVGATPGILTKTQFETDPRFKNFPIKREKIS